MAEHITNQWHRWQKGIIPFCLMLLSPLAVHAQTRHVECLDFGWRFHAGHVQGAEQSTFDDCDWRQVDLPHDFQIEQPWVAPDQSERPDNTDVAANIKSRLSSRGFKEMGQGWYRYHLSLADSLQGRRLFLDFGGIMYVGDVYVNGEYVGGTDYGYVGFEVDLTGKLRVGEDNVIAVRADTREPQNSRWYTGGGLYRGVKLVATSADVFFTRHPLYIRTHDNRFVNISAEFTNRGREKTTRLDVRIIDPDGKEVYQGFVVRQRNTMSRTMEAVFPEVEIANP